MYSQWIGGLQVRVPMVQSDIARGQCHVLEHMATHGRFHQGMWAGSLQHPPLCSSHVVQGLDLSWTGKGLLEPIEVISFPWPLPVLGQRIQGWVSTQQSSVQGLVQGWVYKSVQCFTGEISRALLGWKCPCSQQRGVEEGGFSSLEHCGPKEEKLLQPFLLPVGGWCHRWNRQNPEQTREIARARGLGRSWSPTFLLTASHVIQYISLLFKPVCVVYL